MTHLKALRKLAKEYGGTLVIRSGKGHPHILLPNGIKVWCSATPADSHTALRQTRRDIERHL